MKPTDDHTVEVFVDWLYTRRLPVTNEEWNEDEYRLERGAQWHTAVQVAMIKAYAFADRMLLPDLRQALEHELIDYFIVEGCSIPYYGAVIYAFAHLPPASPVLRAMDRCSLPRLRQYRQH